MDCGGHPCAQIQTLDNSGRGDPAIDPDLPPELRAALQAERREQQQQQQQPFYRPYGGGFSGGHLWHSHECKPGKMLL